RDSNNQENGNSGNEGSNNQENGNSKNEKISHQKENTSKKSKQKYVLKLPKTGELNSFEYILLGIILLGMDLLYIIIKRNGEIEDEKN
ncbi:TPA: LPXTG cell wall anchor domain-containing protein, partial [Enterococcus faecalis]|nr:LPXTG cell wall anchor domain-containing protein [Enterococcus faecalis]